MRSASIFILRRVLYHPRRMWKWYRVYPIEIIGCYCFLHKSPLRLHTYGYPCKMCSASVFVVKFKIYTRKRFNARINVVRISNMMGDDGIARSWKSDWEPNSGIVVSFASDDNSPLLRTNRKPQFIATVFTPITKRLSVFYCICGILIAAIVVGQLDLVNSFGEADRESYINRATAVTCISPLLI